MHRLYLYLPILFLTTCASLAQAQVSVRAYFNPPKIAQGSSARYIVEITEKSTQSMPANETVNTLNITPVEGLALRNGRISTSQQTNIINLKNEFSITQTLTVDATPEAVGSYSIAPYNLTYKGDVYIVPSATLEVIERGADAEPSVDELIYLDVVLPESLYLGQIIETELKLYCSANVSIRSLNNFNRTADGYTVSELPDESIESSEFIDGRRYRVYSWPLQITPIRSGSQSIEFEFAISALIPQQRNQRDPMGMRSPFGSSIFDDVFGRAQQINLYTPPTRIEVKPLPLEHQPESFSGAIGDFNLQVFADTKNTSVDEPIMLSLKLSGKGNFDRISGPELPKSASWIHYDPESSFEPKNDSKLEGTKRFDYVFIPQKSGTLELPEVKFSFFDPETEEYVELGSPPIEVSVKPSARGQLPAPTNSKQPTAEAAPSAKAPVTVEASPEERLLTLNYQPKPSKQSLDRNLLQSTAFWAVNLALAVITVGGYIYIRRHRTYRNSSVYALKEAAKKSQKMAEASIKDAISSSNREAFYEGVQMYIRSYLTRMTGKNQMASTKSEIKQALIATKATESEQALLAETLNDAELVRFSGGHQKANTPDLERNFKQLQAICKKL
jgi:hypothetical protein